VLRSHKKTNALFSYDVECAPGAGQVEVSDLTG